MDLIRYQLHIKRVKESDEATHAIRMDAGAPALLGEPNDAEDGLLLRRLDSLDQPVPVVDTPVRIHSCGKLLGLAQRYRKRFKSNRD